VSELLILPDGYYGRIARRPSNIDPPDFKAAVRRWREWREQSPLYRLDRWLWEREKDRLRAIWFSLTPRQRQYLKDQRRETGVKILYAKPFNGPRYQLGMLSGMSVRRAVQAGGGGTLALSASNNTATNVDFSPGAPLQASFEQRRDGFHYRANSSGNNQINTGGDWVTPRNAFIGDDYEVIWNHITGLLARLTGGSTNYTEDVWTTISTTRNVGQSTSSASIITTHEIDIGDVGTSTSDVNQDYQCEAGDIV
jgi:hypothetical protein